MNFTLFLIIITFLYILTHHQNPLPDNYTQQPIIQLHPSDTLKKLVFAPDQASMVYTTMKLKTIFKSTLYTTVSQTQISLQISILDFRYNSISTRLYVLVKSSSDLIRLYKIVVDKGFMYGSSIMIGIPDKQFLYNTDYVKMSISQSRIAIFNKNILYSINIQNQSNPIIQNKYIFNNQSVVLNAEWHPILSDQLYVALNNFLKNGSFIIYNSTSNEIKVLDNDPTKNVGFLNNGNIILRSRAQDQVVASQYQNEQLKILFTIPYFSLFAFSVNMIQNKNQQIIAGVDILGPDKNVKVYQLQYIDNNSDSNNYYNQSKQVPNNRQINNNIYINTNNLVQSDNNHLVKLNISNLVKLNTNINFKLLFSKNYTQPYGFYGMSPDGNQIYLNKDSNNTIIGYIDRFRRCIDGTFIKSGQCTNCSSNCKTCSNYQNSCTSCLSTQVINNFYCFECSEKYYGCLSCQNNNCSICNQTANFIPNPDNNKCSCKDHTYPINQGRQCKFCTDILAGCNKCQNDKNCTQCSTQNNFIPDGNGKCKCDLNYTFINKNCVNCFKIMGCLNCSAADNCTECNKTAKLKLKDGKCQCIQGCWLNQTQCEACSDNIYDCAICSQDGSKCEKCSSQDRKLSQDKTKCLCQEYKYESQDKKCLQCDQYKKCIICSNSLNCIQCDQSKNWYKTPLNGKCTCQQGFFELNNTCYLCQSPGCIHCFDTKNCSECSSKRNFNITPVNGTCQCKADTYFDSNRSQCFQCNQTMEGCLNCTSFNICILCDESVNYQIKDDKNGCECVQGYISQNKSCQSCQKIVQYCYTCSIIQNAVECNQCKEGFTYNKQSNVCECSQGYQIKDSVCKNKQQSIGLIIIIIIIVSVIIVVVVVCLMIKRCKKNKIQLENDKIYIREDIKQNIKYDIREDIKVDRRVKDEQTYQPDEQEDVSDAQRARQGKRSLLGNYKISIISQQRVK